MSNSPLVDYTRISPNRNSPRNHKIDTITIHCVVGQCSVETLGRIFAPSSRQASSNYGIGYDGKIGMYVEEKDRSWCSCSRSNDNRAITIEVASDTTAPYAVNSKAYAALIKLLVDICKRNDIKELKWKNDKSLIGNISVQNMTVHRWFAATACPGDYLMSKMGDIAEEVNKQLGVKKETNKQPSSFKKGELVSIKKGAKYYNGSDIPDWVNNQKWYVEEVDDNRVVINKSEDGKSAIMSPVHANYLVLVKKDKPSKKSFTVQVTATALNIRKGPSTKYDITGVIRDQGIYTIVDQEGTWGKLKSGAGWISLNYTKPYGDQPKPQYRTYTVKKNDNLWDIADKYLGDGERYPEIKKLNGLKSDTIYEGQKLKLPNK